MKFIQNSKLKTQNSQRGFSILETLIGVSVFILMSVSIYQVYMRVLDAVSVARAKVVASALINEQFEIIRNLPYSDVGIEGGIPNGKIKASQTLVRNNTSFVISSTVRNIDDAFDGILDGSPNDLSPADYKFIEVEVTCPLCKNFQPVTITGRVAPKNLETASTNGALFVKVIDANGQPVSGVDIHIENNLEVPAIIIDDTTNINGELQIVDAPPGAEAYEVSVSKLGYSSDKTYPVGYIANPNPTKPHATVLEQQVTQITFAIDKTSTININSVTEACVPIEDVGFSITGSKLIGTSPDILKYNQSFTTGLAGFLSVSDVEWDSYNIIFNDPLYDLAGSIPLLPVNIIPNSTENIKLLAVLKDPNSLLVTVVDAATGLPLTDASVNLDNGAASTTLITNQGFFHQTDWSGGGGQIEFIDKTRYFSSDGNTEKSDPVGDLRLKDNFGIYVSDGEIESSSFVMGTGINFDKILWSPQDQPVEVGPDSIKFQIATNNDNLTWNFLGPDGTNATFYTLGNQSINAIHNGYKYLRYKVFLHTDDTYFTPNLSDVSFTFTSGCIPPGQVLFKNLANDTYTLTVTKTEYQDFIDGAVDVSLPWDQLKVLMIE
jgi:type II secretory pathway pseudopilin PulG